MSNPTPTEEHPTADLSAGNAFRETLVERADGYDEGGAPMWFGWAVMDAFLAGAAYGRANAKPEK